MAAENRVEGDPSAPRDLPSGQGGEITGSDETLEVAAPAAPLESDIWRDYDPGSDNKENQDANGSIADMVSESLSESDDGSSLADGPVMTKGAEPVAVGSDKEPI